jgi:SAM-dependent methyltransferase/uncharacterized protein YbaR (Trm112 family)
MDGDKDLLKILRCPATGSQLHFEQRELVSADGGQRYPVVEGIPCLMPKIAASTHQGFEALRVENEIYSQHWNINDEGVRSFLNGMIVATCGNLFHGVRLSDDYPIPDFPEFEVGATVLDIGCNWGRWCIAGAQKGYKMIGVDIHLQSLLCARRLAQKLVPENPPHFVLADARYLPFGDECFGGVFSYSVIQHFNKTNAAALLAEVHRVMRRGAKSIIQMPNREGVAAILTKGRMRRAEGTEFDVRYYSIDELLAMFESRIGRSEWEVDCFLGLNVHARDRRFVPWQKRWIIDVADVMLHVSRVVPGLAKLADSLFVSSIKA